MYTGIYTYVCMYIRCLVVLCTPVFRVVVLYCKCKSISSLSPPPRPPHVIPPPTILRHRTSSGPSVEYKETAKRVRIIPIFSYTHDIYVYIYIYKYIIHTHARLYYNIRVCGNVLIVHRADTCAKNRRRCIFSDRS